MVQPFHTILSPVDVSENTHIALEYVAYVARQCDATVHLLYVLPPTEAQLPPELYHPRESGGADFEWAETTAKEQLHTLAQQHLGEGLRYKIHIRVGEAATGVLEIAEAIEAHLIVMMTHSRTGLSRLLLGSVTEKVMRESLCPVLAIPGR
jgi:nucleotide-binding universal stress UspA family protein